MPTRKKSEIKQTDLETVKSNGSKLTSDLPSRNGQGSAGRARLKWLLFIIFTAGLVGFLIPAYSYKQDQKSLTRGDHQAILNNIEQEKQPQEEKVSVYVEKEFAVVRDNEVGHLNVRAEPTASSQRLGQLKIGDKVAVIREDENDWILVELPEIMSGETQGWISGVYVDKVMESVEIE